MPSLDPRTDQRGSTTTELALLMPVVLMLVLLIVQFGLWQHARQVALAAAQEGLAVAQVPAGTAEAAQARAETFLAEAGGVREPAVQAERTLATARVEVLATTPAVLPGAHIAVRGVAEGAVERWVPESER